MNRESSEYRLAAYAAAVAVVLFAASGAVVVSGLGSDRGPGGMAPDAGEPADDATPTEDADRTETNASDFETVEVSIAENASGTSGTLTVTSSDRSCNGVLHSETSSYTRSDVQVENTTVTLVYDDRTPFEEIDRRELAELVWTDVADRAEFGEYEHVELRIDQYYESTERDRPLGAAGVVVRPADGCLPSASGEVDLDNGTVDIRRTLPTLDGPELAYTDELGVLDGSDEALIEELLVTDGRASYAIQNRFDDPGTLNATVVEASNDGEVDLELTSPDEPERTVFVTVDLDEETVVRSTTVLEVTEVDGTDGGSVNISVETNTTAEWE